MQSDVTKRFVDAQKNLVVQHSDFSLRAVFDMAMAGSIDLDPHYQRRDRWKVDKQSALIESFILNVPVPPVYLSEDDFGEYSVIDGKQRLTAIRDFLRGDFSLSNLTRFRELEGAKFTELPTQIQNALTVRPYIRVITLLRQTDPELKYEVFLRLNTGGEKLLAQEIRNVAFSGTLNDLLMKLSEAKFLRSQLKITSDHSPPYRRMDDVELVLRFLTVAERWEKIGQVPSQEMDSFMQKHRHAAPDVIARFEKRFLRSLKACQEIWQDHAFHKPSGQGWRDQFIAPLFDAEMVAVDSFDDRELARLVQKREDVVQGFVAMYQADDRFVKSVSQSTNNPSSIRYRIQEVIRVLRELV